MDTNTLFVRGVLALGIALLAAQARAQVATDAAPLGRPVASDGGDARVVSTTAVPEADDPVNARVAADTVDGLIVAITLDGAQVRLDSALPARVPRAHTRPRDGAQGDLVTVTGWAGGREVTRNAVPDTVLNASERDGLVRTPRRQVVVALATDRALDSVRVEAPATQAAQSLDVRSAYANYCRAAPDGQWCPHASAASRP